MAIPKGFKPMLAATVEPHQLAALRYPLLASPKLDGVRCIVFDGVAYSRNLKPIRNKWVQEKLGKPEYHGFDGELIVGAPTGDGVFNRSQSGVMSTEGAPDFMFRVFDNHAENHRGFEARNYALPLRRGYVARHKHVVVRSVEEVENYENLWLGLGYEGVMLRAPDGPYKYGRSTLREGYLLKLKRFRDGEAVVVDIEEAEENTNAAFKDELGRTKRSTAKAGKVGKGMVGTIVGKDIKTGELLRCGPGTMTHLERSVMWENRAGYLTAPRVFTYRVFDYGAKDTPRFPLFHGWRNKADM